MKDRNELFKYCMDRFLEENIVAKREDIAMVFKYEEEYYLEAVTDDDTGINFIYTTEEDIAEYIHSQKPDIPKQTILEVMESHDDFHMNLAKYMEDGYEQT